MAATPIDEFVTLYEDLHRHPELSFQEAHTAGLVAERLRALGYDVTTGVGRTGAVRATVLAAVERIVRGATAAAGAPAPLPTPAIGRDALVAAARAWLSPAP